jgi:hypothetical protein
MLRGRRVATAVSARLRVRPRGCRGARHNAPPSRLTDRLGLNHLGHTKQIGPKPNQRNHQRPVTAAQLETRRRPPQCDIQLMTKKQVLGFKPHTRLEHINQHSEICGIASIVLNDAMILPRNANPMPDRIFGKDRPCRLSAPTRCKEVARHAALSPHSVAL